MNLPIWSYFAIWLICGFAIALIIGKAMRGVDDTPEPQRDCERPLASGIHVEPAGVLQAADDLLAAADRFDRAEGEGRR
jgi:hypothetical protein